MNKRLILSMAQAVGDPDGGLFFELDLRGAESDIVSYDFNGVSYEWERGKSNDCLKYNGFSFFYAVQVDLDHYVFFSRDPNSPAHENRSLSIGYPYGDSRNNMVMVVVVELYKVDFGKYRVISAFEVDEFSRYGRDYTKHKIVRQKLEQGLRRRAEIDGVHLRNPRNRNGSND